MFNCGDNPAGGEGNKEPVILDTLSIESLGDDELSSAEEGKIAAVLESWVRHYYSLTVLTNSALFADFDKTDLNVIAKRTDAALAEIDTVLMLCSTIVHLEETLITPKVTALQKKLAKKGVSQADSGKPDIARARRLMAMYMDEEYNAKYTLANVSKATNVSMGRLRSMMTVYNNELNAMVDMVDVDEKEAAYERTVIIRDAAITAETMLITSGAGGVAAAAGNVGKVAKTLAFIEKANTVISLTDQGLSASIGTDSLPAGIKELFKWNKRVGYVLNMKDLASKVDGNTAEKIVAIVGNLGEAQDVYISMNAGKLLVSEDPVSPETDVIGLSESSEAGEMLLSGDYSLPPIDYEYAELPQIWQPGDTGTAAQVEAAGKDAVLDLIDSDDAAADNFQWVSIEENLPVYYGDKYVSEVPATFEANNPGVSAGLVDEAGIPVEGPIFYLNLEGGGAFANQGKDSIAVGEGRTVALIIKNFVDDNNTEFSWTICGEPKILSEYEFQTRVSHTYDQEGTSI